MIILFPSEPFSPKEVDSSLKSEYEAAKLVGFNVYLFDHDEFVSTGKLKHNLPELKSILSEKVILRSWMLKEEQYQMLWSKLYIGGYRLINNYTQYLNCHY